MEKARESILITGSTGLIGSRIVELLSNKFEFVPLSKNLGFDITTPTSFAYFEKDPSSIVIHLAAKTDVDGCEKEKELGEKSEAWNINVIGTKNIVEFCERTHKKLIFFSTDFVFDGKKDPELGGYTEEDPVSPLNFYAQTKVAAEQIILQSQIPSVIIRTAFPYRSYFPHKLDLVRVIIDKLQKKQKTFYITDQIITPTFVDDIAYAIQLLIDKNATGIFNVVGGSFLSPHNLALQVAEIFNFDTSLIGEIDLKTFYKGRAERPYNSLMKNDKISELGIAMKDIQEGLSALKTQLS